MKQYTGIQLAQLAILYETLSITAHAAALACGNSITLSQDAAEYSVDMSIVDHEIEALNKYIADCAPCSSSLSSKTS
jgi:hypothetical protein